MAPSAKCGSCAKYIKVTDGAKCNLCGTLFHRTCSSLPQNGPISPTWCCRVCRNRTQRGETTAIPAKSNTPLDTTEDKSRSPSTSSAHAQLRSFLNEMRQIFKEELRAELPTAIKSNAPEDEEESRSPNTSVEPGQSAQLLIFMNELRQMFKEELRAEFLSIREELSSIRSDMLQLQSDKEQLKECMDSMDIRMGVLEQKIAVADPIEVVAQLRQELNDRDQQLLINDLEITNLPETSCENLYHTIVTIATKTGVTLEERDIVSVNRVGLRHINATSSAGPLESRPRPIVVRLARRDLRDQLMRAARVRREVNSTDLNVPGPPRRFFINERLTKQNRILFHRARELAQRHDWQYVWTRHGHILARHKPGDKTRRVRCEEDLLQISSPISQLSS